MMLQTKETLDENIYISNVLTNFCIVLGVAAIVAVYINIHMYNIYIYISV